MHRFTRAFPALVPASLLIAFVTACSSSTEDGGPGPGGNDAAVSADARPDAMGVDALPDSGVITDATVADSGDASPRDTGPSPDASTFCDLAGVPATGVTVPSGFCVRKFATMPVATPRVLAFAPNGDLFVASPHAFTPSGVPAGAGAIFVLPDDNHDGVADAISRYMEGSMMETVHGLLFSPMDGTHGSELWFTTETAVHALPYTSGDRRAPGGAPRMVADMSDLGVSDRWTHNLARSSDGTVFVSRGQYDNKSCPQRNRRSGAVLKIGTGHDLHGDIAITGLRNPLFMRCAPWSAACFAAELSGDGWLGVGGVEKLVEIRDGDDFGYPCCINRNVPNPFISPPPDCSTTGVVVEPFPLHDTPFGFDWDRGRWPAPYTNGLFVAQHGEVGSWINTGIKWAPVDPGTHRPGALQNFATGFGSHCPPNSPTLCPVQGRTADLVFAPDGRMFFSDDQGQAVYWVAPTTLARP